MNVKKLLSLFAVLILAACGTPSGTSDPWSHSGAAVSGPAEEAPSPLLAGTPPRVAYPGAPPPFDYNAQRAPAYSGEYNPLAAMPGTATPDYQIGAPAPIPSTPAPPAPVKVALLVPLSGSHADLGQALLQAAQLALFDMEYDSFELMPRDTKGTTEGAREAAQAAAENGAQLILGPLFATEVRGAKPVARRHNLTMVSFSTDSTLADAYTYIMGFTPQTQVERIVSYAAARGLRNIGVFAPSTEYGNAVVETLTSHSRQIGLPQPHIQRFPNGKQDLSSEAESFAAAHQRRPFDAILLPVGGEQAKAIANLMVINEISAPAVRFLGTGLWDDYSITSEAALRGGWFASSAPALRRNYERRYRELYGRTAPRLSTLAYDATALAAVLARNGHERGSGPDFSREGFTNPNGFSGIDGIFRFRHDSLVERGLAVMEVAPRDIRVIDDAPRTFQNFHNQRAASSTQRYGGF